MSQPATDIDYAPDMGPEDSVEYDRWFRAKVQASLDDPRPCVPRPCVPHAQVMAEMKALLDSHRQASKT